MPGAIWNSISHAVDGVRLAGRPDVDGRHDEGHLAGGRGLAQPAAHLALRSARQQRAVHVRRPARHRRTGVDVLLDGVCGEAFRRQDRDLAGVHVGLRGHAQHAAEVVDMAVGVDHRDDGAVTAAVGAVQRQRRGGCLGGHQWIDDDDAGVALDEGDVREVEAADLIDARHHFVQALFGGQGRLPPQAGVHRGRRGAVEECVHVVVPHHAAVGRLDDAGDSAAMNPRSASSKSVVSWNGRSSSLWADSMTAVGGLWIHRQYIAIPCRPDPRKHLFS